MGAIGKVRFIKIKLADPLILLAIGIRDKMTSDKGLDKPDVRSNRFRYINGKKVITD